MIARLQINLRVQAKPARASLAPEPNSHSRHSSTPTAGDQRTLVGPVSQFFTTANLGEELDKGGVTGDFENDGYELETFTTTAV